MTWKRVVCVLKTSTLDRVTPYYYLLRRYCETVDCSDIILADSRQSWITELGVARMDTSVAVGY